ncbi:hypothetical protein ACI78V_07320 [Geodermatophilus sp. SYSU D00742]
MSSPSGSEPDHVAGGGPQPPGGGRPFQVLAAAALGFVVAFFLLVGALVLFAASTVFGALSAVFGALYLALTALNVVGGVQAIQGRGSTLLKIAGGITAGLGVISLATYLVQGSFDLSTLVSILIGAAIVFLLQQPASKAYFAARGTR